MSSSFNVTHAVRFRVGVHVYVHTMDIVMVLGSTVCIASTPVDVTWLNMRWSCRGTCLTTWVCHLSPVTMGVYMPEYVVGE